MDARARALLAAILALLVGLLVAPSALAVTATVRVEAAPFTVAPLTKVDVSPTARFFDASGTPYRSFYIKDGKTVFYASALGALAAAGERRGFSFEAAYGGDFITNIAGFGALPDYSQGWIYAVNGAGYPVVDVGALSFALHRGDSVLFTQYPDGAFAHGTKALYTRLTKTVLTTGEALTITVVGDDLAKANSAVDATRFGVGADAVETSSQFAPVEGALVHVGTASYVSDANGVVTVVTPPAGTSRVWAERDMDASFAYVRSPQRLVNVADPLVLSGLTVTPRTFSPGQRVSIKFAVSRSATVKYTVRTKAGRLIAALSRRVAGGSVTMRWDGRTGAGRAVRPGTYTIRVTAVDTWGRTATPLRTTVVAR
jgi:FlgD Ig-like domain